MSQEASDAALFAGLKKKKKTKAVADDALPSSSSAAPTPAPAAAPQPPPPEPTSDASLVDSRADVDTVVPTKASADLTLREGEEPLGGGEIKKKKKKTFNLDELDSAPTSAAPLVSGKQKTDALGNVVEDDTSNDPSLTAADGSVAPVKKKKKAKKALDLEGFEAELAAAGGAESAHVIQATPAAAAPQVVKREEGDEDAEGGEQAAEGGEGEQVEGAEGVFADDANEEGEKKEVSKALLAAEKAAWNEPDQRGRDYEYIELLGRFYSILYDANPALSNAGGKRRLALPPPAMARDGNKRSIFANVADISKKLHRQPEHVIQFLFAELGTTGSVDGSARLVIKGRFQAKQIENVLRRYIVEYVTCKTCKSNNTILLKDNRIYFVECEDCRSRRSVSAIKTGFQAQTGKRSRKAAA